VSGLIYIAYGPECDRRPTFIGPLLRGEYLRVSRFWPEDILDLNHQIRGKSAIFGVPIDSLGVISFMNAVKFVTGGIGAAPNVGHAKIFHHAVGICGNILQLLSR
jgi:hypothetical protein